MLHNIKKNIKKQVLGLSISILVIK